MHYREAIQEGFRIINRNWQLVLLQILAVIVTFIGFFMLVLFPLFVAFVIFGLDLTELSRVHDILDTLRRPSEILTKYFSLAILVLVSILLYLLAVFSLGVYVFGGSIGIISRSIMNAAERFQMKAFLAEGKRLFLPLIGFTTVIGLVFVALAFVLGLFGGAVAGIVSLAKEHEATLALFLGIFFSLILLLIVVLITLITLAITLYGAASMAMRGSGPVQAIREALHYLYRHAGGFYLYCIVFGGYLMCNLLLVMVGYPMKHVPLIGLVIAPVFQFAVTIIQSYLGLVMLAAIFSYYAASGGAVAEGGIETADEVPSVTAETSSEEQHSAEPQVRGSGDAPPQTEGRE